MRHFGNNTNFQRFLKLVYRWAPLILQHFRHLTYVTTQSPTLPSLYLRHSSFSNPSVASPTSQFILQPFLRFSYVTSSAHSPTFPSHRTVIVVAQLILQPFRRFTYVTAHSPTLPLLHLRHISVSNPSLASLASQDLHLIHLASRPWCGHNRREWVQVQTWRRVIVHARS